MQVAGPAAKHYEYCFEDDEGYGSVCEFVANEFIDIALRKLRWR